MFWRLSWYRANSQSSRHVKTKGQQYKNNTFALSWDNSEAFSQHKAVRCCVSTIWCYAILNIHCLCILASRGSRSSEAPSSG